MENFVIWVIAVGAIVLIGLFFFWRQTTSNRTPPPPSPTAAQPPAPTNDSVKEVEKQHVIVEEKTAVSPPPPLPEQPTGPPTHILVVDDMSIWADTIRQFSTLFNCEVRHAARLTAAVQELARWQPQLIILDLHMPRDPWQPIQALRHKYAADQKTLAFCEQVTTHPKLSHIVVAITSVEEQAEQQALALSAGAHHFFTKGDFSVNHFKQLLTEVEKHAVSPPSSPS